jgi:hypothetical protein
MSPVVREVVMKALYKNRLFNVVDVGADITLAEGESRSSSRSAMKRSSSIPQTRRLPPPTISASGMGSTSTRSSACAACSAAIRLVSALAEVD